jgi:hypothetical protein
MGHTAEPEHEAAVVAATAPVLAAPVTESAAARVLALQRTVGNAAVGRILARATPAAAATDPRSTFPWVGEIHRPWSAALRSAPRKDPADPHRGTIADLPRGTEVTVVRRNRGWLNVQATVGGKPLSGWVSQELVKYRDPATPRVFTVAEAFVELKRAEMRKAKDGDAFKPTEEEQERIDLAVKVLSDTKKYLVDTTSFRVNFDRSAGSKTQVTTIEDFVLFVEEVERAFPSATPEEIASEVRQLWFSDVNWELLVASQGIRSGGRLVDIESEAPIATSFDMKQIAPAKGSFQLDTAMGRVDIGHVISGIDASLSGFPSAYPERFLEEREAITGDDHDTYKSAAKYRALQAGTGGDNRDFTTWSGDLGQAYAEYLVDRHLLGNKSATLAGWATVKALREEILGDIHGYIAVEVWKSTTASSPSGAERKVSNILRDMYLVPKGGATYGTYFEKVSGKAPADQKAFIADRALAFARNWYAKRAQEEKGTDAWSYQGAFDEKSKEFDTFHALNESSADPKDKLEVMVDDLLNELGGTVK